jgi:hypothetical protein
MPYRRVEDIGEHAFSEIDLDMPQVRARLVAAYRELLKRPVLRRVEEGA